MFTVDVKQQHNNITLTQDKDLPNDNQTNIHSNNVPRQFITSRNYGTPEGAFLFQYLPEKKSKQMELEKKSKQ